LNERHRERGNQGCRSILKQAHALNWPDSVAWANAKAGAIREVGSRRAEVRGRRTEDGGRRSEDGGQRSDTVLSSARRDSLIGAKSGHESFKFRQSASVIQSPSGKTRAVQGRVPGLRGEDGERGEESFLWVHRQRR
jgi:hypothetical protein